MARTTRKAPIARPEILRAEMPYRDGQLVLHVTNGKRAVLFVDQWQQVTYAMINNEVTQLVTQLEQNLVRV